MAWTPSPHAHPLPEARRVTQLVRPGRGVANPPPSLASLFTEAQFRLYSSQIVNSSFEDLTVGEVASAKRPKTGGRVLGTPNLKTMKLYQQVCERVGRYPYMSEDGLEYNPIVELAKIGMERHPTNPKEFRHPVDVRILCHKEVAQYFFSKRAAITITDEGENKSLEKREALVTKLLDTLQGKILDVTPTEVNEPGDVR